MPTTPGMKGEGYYDQHSTAQGASYALLRDWIEGAMTTLALPTGQAVRLLDLGSSEGRNAIAGMTDAVQVLRRRSPQPVWTIYHDQPSNNFNRLFANLEAHRAESPPDVYAAAVAGDFY